MEDNKKTRTADLLFVIQFVGMITFIGAQALKMTQTVQGISPTWLICGELFSIINATLAFCGWRLTPTRSTLQLFITHGGWSVGVGVLLALLVSKAHDVGWSWYDSVVLASVLAFVICLKLNAELHGASMSDPVTLGRLAAVLRGIPHLTMAYKISLFGGSGLAAVTVFVANATALIRIAQLAVAVRTNGWDRTRRGIAIGEAASELSWIVVTVVWFMK